MAIDPWPGATLQSSSANTYLLQSKLGEGAFGAVYAAVEQPSGKKVAVKLLHAKHAQNKALTARFLQEEQIANRLEHPDAVQFYASGETPDGTLWLAMEFIPGEPLDDYLRRKGALGVKEALTILGPICEVLDEAHKKGIIHRDLKPQNMMVVELGRHLVVKVLDFGIAKFSGGEAQSQTGTSMGTPMYMPPEQWESSKKVTPASDIYALGMIAYQCLTGKLPFQADSIPSWIKAHTQDPPAPLAQVVQGRLPAALCDVVMQAIEKDPEVRFSSALALKNALEEAIKGSSSALTVVAESSLPQTPQASPSLSTLPLSSTSTVQKQRSAMPWVVLGAILFVTGGVALYLLSTKSAPTPKTSPSSSESKPSSQPINNPAASLATTSPIEVCTPQLRFTLPDKSIYQSGDARELHYEDGDAVTFSFSLLEQTSPKYITLLVVGKDGVIEVLSPSELLPQVRLSPGERLEIPAAINENRKEKIVIRARTKEAKEGGEGLLVLIGENPEEPKALQRLTPPKSREAAEVKAAVQKWREARELSAPCDLYQYYAIKSS